MVNQMTFFTFDVIIFCESKTQSLVKLFNEKILRFPLVRHIVGKCAQTFDAFGLRRRELQKYTLF